MVKKKEEIVKENVRKVNISPRGRTFEGIVIKKFHGRVVIEFERLLYLRKYERYEKRKTKVHAKLPKEMEKEINLGDWVEVAECRPLSKIIHAIVVRKIRGNLDETN